MNLIYELLSCILSFSLQVSNWCSSHAHSYQTMTRTYKAFRDTVRLLISGQSTHYVLMYTFTHGLGEMGQVYIVANCNLHAPSEMHGHDIPLFDFIVLSKLIARGYQPHLEELALRLNFNSFY